MNRNNPSQSPILTGDSVEEVFSRYQKNLPADCGEQGINISIPFEQHPRTPPYDS